MKYEGRSLEGYITGFFRPIPIKSGRVGGKRGKAKNIVRDIVSLKFWKIWHAIYIRRRNPCQGTIISSCIWSETVARQMKSLQARFFRISARKDSAHLTHHQPDSDNSRRSRKWACKELLLTKGFWRDLGKTKQNMWTEVLLKRLNQTASGSKI